MGVISSLTRKRSGCSHPKESMKTRMSWLVAVLWMVATSEVPAQTDPAARAANATIVEQGPHHRVWRSGDSSYTELATGLNRLNEKGEWEPSGQTIELFNDGAVYRSGQWQAVFSPNSNRKSAVDLLTPDGKRLQSSVLGIAYFDSSTGESILLAELKDSVGQLVAPNQLIYPDAFEGEGILADLRYVVNRWGLEQDIVLHSTIDPPSAWGLNPATSRLMIMSEFFDTDNPQVKRREPFNPAGAGAPATNQVNALPDHEIVFGSMSMQDGKAFVENDRANSVHVAKSYERIDGRSFLIEEIRYEEIKPSLDRPPLAGWSGGSRWQENGPPETGEQTRLHHGVAGRHEAIAEDQTGGPSGEEGIHSNRCPGSAQFPVPGLGLHPREYGQRAGLPQWNYLLCKRFRYFIRNYPL